MQQYGFKSAGTCNCGGVYTEKYRCDTYLVRIRPRRYKFAIYEDGSRTMDWTDLSQLENKLNEIFPRDKETTDPQGPVSGL